MKTDESKLKIIITPLFFSAEKFFQYLYSFLGLIYTHDFVIEGNGFPNKRPSKCKVN